MQLYSSSYDSFSIVKGWTSTGWLEITVICLWVHDLQHDQVLNPMKLLPAPVMFIQILVSVYQNVMWSSSTVKDEEVHPSLVMKSISSCSAAADER